MAQLLVSVRGANEALEAAFGGATIADVEYPASALGTPYPLNIQNVRITLKRNKFKKVLVSTNIGEKQDNRSTACQAAVGVGVAGADIIKCGLAELRLDEAVYLGRLIVRSVREFFPLKKIIPAVFVDDEMQRYFDPFRDGIELIRRTDSDGLLIDTYDKSNGRGLLDYCEIGEIKRFARMCHNQDKEAWIAGSISIGELPTLWSTGVDVVCVRGAACEQKGDGRFGDVKRGTVADLVATMQH